MDRKIHYVGDIEKVISSFESAYHLKNGAIAQITDPTIKRFPSWVRFVQEAELSQDHEYKAMIDFLDTYHEDALKVLKVIKRSCLYGEVEADVVVTTAHKAKGKEWTQVLLNDDFKTNNTEEDCIFYVAVTRAIETLELQRTEDCVGTQLLTIELVPTTCWFSNVRSQVRHTDWEKLKKYTFKTAGHRCEVCRGTGKQWPVECHEIWHFDDKRKTQTLKGLIALCPPCNQVKRISFATWQGKGDEAAAHLGQVNQWKPDQAQHYIDEQFQRWRERSLHKWKLDITWLENLGIPLLKRT